MELLIKRDPTWLDKVDGESFVEDSVPIFLKSPKVVYQSIVKRMLPRSNSDDLLIKDKQDWEDSEKHLSLESKYSTVTPALWSGYRSVLTKELATGKLFRIKGVSLDVNNPKVIDVGPGLTKIVGGQEEESADNEKILSDRFNKILEDNGIEPAMKVRGMWKYPILAREDRPVASIMEVKGDTRLDELLFVLENLASLKCKGELATDLGKRFNDTMQELYFDIGFACGGLKRLMDKSMQTWSGGLEETNAHYGNIVVYNGTDKLKVGIVDFDASCDTKDFSKSKLRAIQKVELDSFAKSVTGGPISARQIIGKPFSSGQLRLFIGLRNILVEGFFNGYNADTKVSNEVDLERLHEVFDMLRKEGVFLAPKNPVRYQPIYESLSDTLKLYKKQDYNLRNSLDDIVNKSYKYQSELKDKISNSNYILKKPYNNLNNYIKSYQ